MLVHPHVEDQKFPSDLHGLILVSYELGKHPSLVAFKPNWMHDKETLADWEITGPWQREQYEKAARATRAYLDRSK